MSQFNGWNLNLSHLTAPAIRTGSIMVLTKILPRGIFIKAGYEAGLRLEIGGGLAGFKVRMRETIESS